MRVMLFGYENTHGRCQGCPRNMYSQRSCCDDFNEFDSCTGDRLCDSYFTYCLRPLQRTGRGCPNNRTSTVNTDDRYINFFNATVLGLPNPLLLPGLTEAYYNMVLQSHGILRTKKTANEINIYNSIEVSSRTYYRYQNLADGAKKTISL